MACNYIKSLSNFDIKSFPPEPTDKDEIALIRKYNNALIDIIDIDTNDTEFDSKLKEAKEYQKTHRIEQNLHTGNIDLLKLSCDDNTKVVGGKRKLKSKRSRKTKKRSTRRRRRTAK